MIWFADADDLLVPDTAALYLDIAEKTRSDIVLGKCISFSESSEVLPTAVGTDHYKIVDFSDPDQFYSTEKSGAVCFGVWVGIFRRDFLIENDVFFREEIRALEEFMFYVEAGVKARRVASVDHYGYYYRLRTTSASHEKACLKNVPEAGKTVLPIMEDLCSAHSEYAHSIQVSMSKIERYAERCLVRSDTAYIRQTLSFYRRKSFYPHRVDLHAYMLKTRENGGIKRAVINWALRIEPLFWIMHYAYKLRQLLKRREKEAGERKE